jgi:RHH-type proline utilization regulon transcriptional repressor/proline dehydrogenase/delta 1-pyrroline-5-carboxylate dehydrogenase
MRLLVERAGGGIASQSDEWGGDRQVGAVLVEGSRARLVQIALEVSRWHGGPVVPVYHVDTVDLALLHYEMAISINTAAAGGNASLMALGDGA